MPRAAVGDGVYPGKASIGIVVGLLACAALANHGCASATISVDASRQPRSAGNAITAIRHVTIVDVRKKQLLLSQRLSIEGKKIRAITPDDQTPLGPTDIDGSHLIALPGFVNTHTHLWQHVARGANPQGILQDWVKDVYKYAHYLTAEDILLVTRAAAAHASRSGTTTLLDFTSLNFRSDAIDATIRGLGLVGVDGGVVWWNPAAFLPPDLRETEIRRIVKSSNYGLWMGYGPLSFWGIPAIYDGVFTAHILGLPMAEHTMENIQEQRDFYKSLHRYLQAHGGELKAADFAVLKALLGMAPPVGPDSLVSSRRTAQLILERYGNICQGEADALAGCTSAKPPRDCQAEADLLKICESEAGSLAEALRRLAGNKERISQVPWLQHIKVLGPRFLSIHSCWQSNDDIALYGELGVSISHNPESNMYLSSGISPVQQYIKKRVNVTLGTDGAASNDGIDMFQAMRAAANLQKIDLLDPALLNATPWPVLQAATMNGAEAMGLGKVTGELVAGKEADIVLLSLDRLGMSPCLVDSKPSDQCASMLVNAASTRDVSYVFSNGEVVVQEGRLTKIDEQATAVELQALTKTLQDRVMNGMARQLDAKVTSPSWYRYESVRKKDHVKMVVSNATGQTLGVRAVLSGTAFGGTVASMLHKEVISRFPGDGVPPCYWDSQKSKDVRLGPGESFLIEKPTQEYSYVITTKGGSFTRPKCSDGSNGASEQILLQTWPAN